MHHISLLSTGFPPMACSFRVPLLVVLVVSTSIIQTLPGQIALMCSGACLICSDQLKL